MRILAFLSQHESWEPASHGAEPWWHSALGVWGPALLAALLLFLVVRALAQTKRYRAVGMLEPSDLDALHEALQQAEKRTVGEIVPVVLERSDSYPGARWLAALSFLLIGSAALASFLPWQQPALLLLSQIALGALGYAVAAALPGFARLFVSEKRATEMAEEQATQEFFGLDLHRTVEQTGVLIFVSLFERRVIVLGDRGINEKVGEEDWKRVDEAVLRGIAKGSLRDGLSEGIACAGTALATHFPWREGNRNEIPDRIVVRKE